VAESFLAHDVLESPGTDRQQIVVHVAAETLRHGAAGCCEIEQGGPPTSCRCAASITAPCMRAASTCGYSMTVHCGS
jgi:hypothetical protein